MTQSENRKAAVTPRMLEVAEQILSDATEVSPVSLAEQVCQAIVDEVNLDLSARNDQPDS